MAENDKTHGRLLPTNGEPGYGHRAKVLNIKVLDDKGGGHEFNLLAALRSFSF